MSTDRRKVEIYDTTLRDGSQLEGISLTVDDKLRIAEQLDWLGVDYIDANPSDEMFRKHRGRAGAQSPRRLRPAHQGTTPIYLRHRGVGGGHRLHRRQVGTPRAGR
jgi:hypothetical protein